MHANTQIEFPKMPFIDARQLNSNSGMESVLQANAKTPFKRIRPLEIAESFQSARSPLANATISTFHHTHLTSPIFGEKEDPKEVMLRMRMRLASHVVDTTGGTDKASKLDHLLQGFSRNTEAMFATQTRSVTIAHMLDASGVPMTKKNLNSLRGLHRTIPKGQAQSKVSRAA